MLKRGRTAAVVLGVAVALAGTGCRDKPGRTEVVPATPDAVTDPFPAEGAADTAVPPSAVPPEPTSGPVPGAVAAVPDTIDRAYVDAVLLALNKVYGDTVRNIRFSGRVGPQEFAAIRAIFNDPLFARQARLFAEVADEDQARLQEPLGDRKIIVQRLLTARPDCIFAQVIFDYSAVLKDPPAPDSAYLTLEPTQEGADPGNMNATPWSMSAESERRINSCNQ